MHNKLGQPKIQIRTNLSELGHHPLGQGNKRAKGNAVATFDCQTWLGLTNMDKKPR